MKGPSEAVLVEADAEQATVLADGSLDTMWLSKGAPSSTIEFNLRKEVEFGGLRIDWGDNYARSVDLHASNDRTAWTKLASLHEGSGRYDLLLHAKHRAKYLRIDLAEPADASKPLEI